MYKRHGQFQPRPGFSQFATRKAHEDETIIAPAYSQVPAGSVRDGTTQQLPVQWGMPLFPAVSSSHLVLPDGNPQPTWMTPPASSSMNRRKARKSIIAALAGITVLLGVIALYLWLDTKQAVDVTLYQVSRQDTSLSIGGGGIVFPQQKLDLSYPVSERVVAVQVKAGDRVTPGQALIHLDPTQLSAQVKQAADNVAAAQAYLNTVSASGNAVTIAQAQQQFDMAKNRYNALVAQSSSPLLRNGDLISPMRGVVTTVNIDAGEVFAANTPLLTIMDESVVVIHVRLPLANIGQVARGQAATVTTAAEPGRNLQGAVSSIILQADPQTDTFEIWVRVPNRDNMLLPGMSAFVRLQTARQAYVVPRLAVLNPAQHPAVFIVEGQQAYLHRVRVLGRAADTVLIGEGLSSGEKVVLVGIDKLRNGQKVRIRAVEGRSVYFKEAEEVL